MQRVIALAGYIAAVVCLATPAWAEGEHDVPPPGKIDGDIEYARTYQAWTVTCNHCRHLERQAACQLRSDALGVSVFGESHITLSGGLLDSATGPVSPGNFTDATLRVALDDTEALVIERRAWGVEGVDGDIWIKNNILTGFLPGLRESEDLTLWVAVGGDNWIATYGLDGFAAALDDLQGHMPFEDWTLDQCCAADPTSDRCR